MWHALFEDNLVLLLSTGDFLTLALLADLALVHQFSFAFAVVAPGTGLCVHSWAEHLHFRDDTATVTSSALTDG